MLRAVRLVALSILLAVLAACGSAPVRVGAPSRGAPPPTDLANGVLFRAIALVGTPYRYGGNTPDGGFDCSGLVGFVFHDATGLTLPRTSKAMSELGAAPLPRDALAPGDLVFFRAKGSVSHVGIYVGENRFVHAPNAGGTVRLEDLDGWWREHFAFGKRVLR